MGSRRSPLTGHFTAPHGDTFRRVLRAGDAAALDTVIGAFLAERASVGPAPALNDDGQRDHGTADPSHDLGGHSDEPIVRALGVDGKAARGARQVIGRGVQVFLVERYVHDLHGNPKSEAAALGLTRLSAAQADPERLATLVHGHWRIESLHWVRDVSLVAVPGLLPGSILLVDSVSIAMAAFSHSLEKGTCVGDLTENS